MEPFVYKNVIGDFLDVLSMNSPLKAGSESACASLFGSTGNQEAVLSRYFGDLSLVHAQDFAASLDALLTSLVELIVLDFSGVISFCPNTAAALVNFATGVQGRGKALALFKPSPATMDMLESLHLTHLFTILHDADDLLIALP